MPEVKFKKTLLTSAVSLVLCSSLSMPLYADGTNDKAVNKEVEVISVTGIHGSLIKSIFGEIGSNDFTVTGSVSNCTADVIDED